MDECGECEPQSRTSLLPPFYPYQSRPVLTYCPPTQVTEVSDFLVANIFPYWEDAPITSSLEYFNAALANISSFEAQEDIEVWIGETGWPVASNVKHVGEPGIENLQKYWSEIVCSKGFQERSAFFYIDCDEGDSPAWGVYELDGGERIDMRCDGPVS